MKISTNDAVVEDEEGITHLPVDVISLESCSKEEFAERYLWPGVPCVIDDLVTEWPAHGKWTKEYFEQDLGRTPVCYHRINDEDEGLDWAGGVLRTQLSDFIARIERGDRIKHFGLSHPMYDFVTTHPTLMQDVRLETIERLLPVGQFCGLGPLDAKWWPWVPPYPPMMFIGGAGSLSAGHYDPDHSHTFHWCVWGRKSVKLFPNDPRWNSAFARLSHVDFSNSLDPVQFREFPELNGLKGWSTILTPGQTLVIPSRMWHFFKNEETSMGFVIRGRSFDSLESYCDFASDAQTPPNVIPFHAQLWRMVDRRQRSVVGNLMARFERPIVRLTRVVLKLLKLFVSGQRHLRRDRSQRV